MKDYTGVEVVGRIYLDKKTRDEVKAKEIGTEFTMDNKSGKAGDYIVIFPDGKRIIMNRFKFEWAYMKYV